MGLISAALAAAGGVMADQWKEYFHCDAMDSDVLMTRGIKRTSGRGGSNNKGEDNIISNGSVIAVNEGQCMIITDQGEIVEVCAEPGEFVYDSSKEPSIFAGKLGNSIKQSFKLFGRRVGFGGQAAREQRVYYFNTKEIMGNKYGTAQPVPFRVVDEVANIRGIDISVRCNGEYSYHMFDPILFYKKVCANVTTEFRRQEIDSQLKSELLTALQPAFGRISEMGIRYSQIPVHTMELAEALNAELSKKWRELRGIEIVSFGVNSIKASAEDEAMLKELQKSAALSNPNMAAGLMAGATANAVQAAASNQNAGPMMAFAGMNMANMTGQSAMNQLFQMGQQAPIQGQPQQTPPQGQAPAAQSQAGASGWTCPKCGHQNAGNFCTECGEKKPEAAAAGGKWFCPNCGHPNEGKFCTDCGTPRP